MIFWPRSSHTPTISVPKRVPRSSPCWLTETSWSGPRSPLALTSQVPSGREEAACSRPGPRVRSGPIGSSSAGGTSPDVGVEPRQILGHRPHHGQNHHRRHRHVHAPGQAPQPCPPPRAGGGVVVALASTRARKSGGASTSRPSCPSAAITSRLAASSRSSASECCRSCIAYRPSSSTVRNCSSARASCRRTVASERPTTCATSANVSPVS